MHTQAIWGFNGQMEVSGMVLALRVVFHLPSTGVRVLFPYPLPWTQSHFNGHDLRLVVLIVLRRQWNESLKDDGPLFITLDLLGQRLENVVFQGTLGGCHSFFVCEVGLMESEDLCPVCKTKAVAYYDDGGSMGCGEGHIWYLNANGEVKEGWYEESDVEDAEGLNPGLAEGT